MTNFYIFVFLKIIITTHYIEEARNSGVVGLMRRGKLLAEENPEILINRYECNNLEEVFLKLCQNNENNNNNEISYFLNSKSHVVNNELSKDFNKKGDNNYEQRKRKTILSSILVYFQLIIILTKNNWLKLCRNRFIVLFYFVLPSLQMSLFNLSVGREPKNVELAIFNGEIPMELSQQYLEMLNTDLIKPINYSSVDLAIDSVVRGDSWAAISISPNFSESLEIRIQEFGFSDDSVVNNSNIHLYSDMSNYVIGLSLFASLALSYEKFAQNFMIANNYNPLAISSPLQLKEIIYGNDVPSMSEFMAPGIFIAIIFFTPLTMTGFLMASYFPTYIEFHFMS